MKLYVFNFNNKEVTENEIKNKFITSQQCIFLVILIQILLKFAPQTVIDNKPASIEIMAWHQTGHRPLSEPIIA